MDATHSWYFIVVHGKSGEGEREGGEGIHKAARYNYLASQRLRRDLFIRGLAPGVGQTIAKSAGPFQPNSSTNRRPAGTTERSPARPRTGTSKSQNTHAKQRPILAR